MFEESSDEEILARAHKLIQEYADMTPALAEHLERFGRLRKELQLLVTEIKARKLPFDDAQENSATRHPQS